MTASTAASTRTRTYRYETPLEVPAGVPCQDLDEEARKRKLVEGLARADSNDQLKRWRTETHTPKSNPAGSVACAGSELLASCTGTFASEEQRSEKRTRNPKP